MTLKQYYPIVEKSKKYLDSVDQYKIYKAYNMHYVRKYVIENKNNNDLHSWYSCVLLFFYLCYCYVIYNTRQKH